MKSTKVLETFTSSVCYQEYVEKVEELGVFRERFGLDDPREDRIISQMEQLWLLLTEEERYRSRSEGWRAWPERRRGRRVSDDDEPVVAVQADE
jgi:hypothetical protein